MSTSDNFDGNNAIGNGEVDSSILSGSTIPLKKILRLECCLHGTSCMTSATVFGTSSSAAGKY
jgi:hypothetical protein